MHTWQFQEANAQFGRLVQAALHGPQMIAISDDEDALIVLRDAEYRRLNRLAGAYEPSSKEERRSGTLFDLAQPVRELCLSDDEVESLFGRDRNPAARGTDDQLFD